MKVSSIELLVELVGHLAPGHLAHVAVCASYSLFRTKRHIRPRRPSSQSCNPLVNCVKKRAQALLPAQLRFDDDLLFRLGQPVGFVAPFRFQEIADTSPATRIIQNQPSPRLSSMRVPFQLKKDHLLA